MRLYSAEWVDAFNEAVADLVPEPGVSFRMRQVVEGGPDGVLVVTLDVNVRGDGRAGDGGDSGGGGGIALHVERGTGTAVHQPTAAGGEPQVTVVLAHDDAMALARGDVDAAKLLHAGRVKVRGNLSALVAGQKILAEAMGRLGPLSERTTF